MARIDLDRVSLQFKVRPEGTNTIKDLLLRWKLRRELGDAYTVQTLTDLSLSLKDGDRVGIIGFNGAGKSSLLKLLSGVYPPTSGKCTIDGKITSLFDIMLGFDGDLTGWDNIITRGYLQGETPKSIRDKTPAIAEFSELGRFLNFPIRCYSAGMLFRLAFSIATACDPEILLIDEVFSAGDVAFRDKAKKRMNDLMSKARIIVMVSHDLKELPEVCQSVLWLHRGQVQQFGPPQPVIDAYIRFAYGLPDPADSATPSQTPNDGAATSTTPELEREVAAAA